MSFKKRVHRKFHKKEERYETEQLMKEKRSEDLQAWEEVFDRSTLFVIYDFLNNGPISEIHGVVSSGKESRIYWGKDSDGDELAVKIFLTGTSEFKKGMLQYIEGDPRFKNVEPETRPLIYTWARKEFKNLEQARLAKVRVPKPLVVRDNVLIMGFIGKNGDRAPLLKEHTPKNPKAMYDDIIHNLQKLYTKAGLVHGDLSEYNIMVFRGKAVLFDMAQSVVLAHPMSDFLLRRDVTNLNKYFAKLGVNVPSTEDTISRITGNGKA